MSIVLAMATGAALALGILVAVTLWQRRRERAPEFMSLPEHWGDQ